MRLGALAHSGIAANAAALACVIWALVNTHDGAIEGAYFNRAVGSDAVVLASYPVTPWLIAAAVLIVLGTAALVLAARRVPR